MDNSVNILYQCDNNYAPYMGVSLTSLFMHNTHISQLRVFLLGKGISDANKEKISKTCEKYKRELIFLDCEELDKRIENYGMQIYRGSYATFYKLFVSELLEEKKIKISRMLYIDSDTLVVKDIVPLYFYDLEGCPVGMVADTLAYQYKEELGFHGKDIYYNAGIILYDFETIKSENWNQKMFIHISEVKADYRKHEQDLMNVVFRGHIQSLPLRYNFQSVHSAANAKQFYKVYKKNAYFEEHELELEEKNRTILHFLRFNGEFPWNENSMHPYAEIFNTYLKQTEWAEMKKIKKSNGIIFSVERIMYKVLPRMLFLRIFKLVHDVAHLI